MRKIVKFLINKFFLPSDMMDSENIKIAILGFFLTYIYSNIFAVLFVFICKTIFG